MTTDNTDTAECSAGARMLADRMRSHPEEFSNDGRFREITNALRYPPGDIKLTARDRAYLKAALDALDEHQLTTDVAQAILGDGSGRFKIYEQIPKVPNQYNQHARDKYLPQQILGGSIAGAGNLQALQNDLTLWGKDK